MDAVLDALGVQRGGVLFMRHLQLLDWGQSLHIRCVYRLSPAESLPLNLTFTGCREMKWRIYAFDDGRDEVMVVDARLGRGGHRSPAHVLTDRFGLTVTYSELQVDRTDAPGAG